VPAWRLEYRAKLAELAAANATRDRVIDSFSSHQGGDPADPHSYANKRIIAALTRRLRLMPGQSLHSVALDQFHAASANELKADSEMLEQAVSPITH